MLVIHPEIALADVKAEIDAAFAGTDPRDRGHELRFTPLGEDSWSFRYGPLWVSVRRDLQGHVPAAYEGALALARAGLDFILPPLAGRDGRVVRTVRGLPVVVFPFVDATPLSLAPPSAGDAARVLEMLAAVHRTAIALDLPRETYALPFAGQLARMHDDAAAAAANDAGPYSRRLHALLADRRACLDQLRAEIAGLAATCAASPDPLVVTHGEPSAQNVLRAGGRLLLIDWGAARWGPPERDTYHVQRTFNVAVDGRAAFQRFYDLRWILGEVAEYAARFSAAHAGNDDDDAMWQRLQHYLGRAIEARPPSS